MQKNGVGITTGEDNERLDEVTAINDATSKDENSNEKVGRFAQYERHISWFIFGFSILLVVLIIIMSIVSSIVSALSEVDDIETSVIGSLHSLTNIVTAVGIVSSVTLLVGLLAIFLFPPKRKDLSVLLTTAGSFLATIPALAMLPLLWKLNSEFSVLIRLDLVAFNSFDDIGFTQALNNLSWTTTVGYLAFVILVLAIVAHISGLKKNKLLNK